MDKDFGQGLWTRTFDKDFGPGVWTRTFDEGFGQGLCSRNFGHELWIRTLHWKCRLRLYRRKEFG